MGEPGILPADVWPWLATLAVLGLYHGVNPAMGWLFAVALGLQERRRSAVLRALPLIAVGHEASIGMVVVLVTGLQFLAAPELLRAGGAIALVAFGAYKFLKPRSHPRWVKLQVSARELAVWSFLMSTAHGAGLMLFPILVGLPEGAASHEHVGEQVRAATLLTDVTAVGIHTAAMLLAMGVVAVVVYERLGLGVLRKAWLNLDRVWATAVIGAGAVTLFT